MRSPSRSSSHSSGPQFIVFYVQGVFLTGTPPKSSKYN